MTPMAALKTYIEKGGHRKLEISELKQLSSEERLELAKLAAEELGVELERKV